MSEEEQFGITMDAMRQLIDENRAIVRLLSEEAEDPTHSGLAQTGPDTTAQTIGSASAVIGIYRQLVDLLEILSATSDRSREGIQSVESDPPNDVAR